jgi:hypothetical protein
MPRFCFHIVHGDRKIVDSIGSEFDDLAAAKKHALVRARNCIVEQMLQDNPHPNGRHFEITDDKGKPLETVRFGDLLPPEMEG